MFLDKNNKRLITRSNNNNNEKLIHQDICNKNEPNLIVLQISEKDTQ